MSGVEALAGRRPAKASAPTPKHYLNVYCFNESISDMVQ
jgi:hypothetical protein